MITISVKNTSSKVKLPNSFNSLKSLYDFLDDQFDEQLTNYHDVDVPTEEVCDYLRESIKKDD